MKEDQSPFCYFRSWCFQEHLFTCSSNWIRYFTHISKTAGYDGPLPQILDGGNIASLIHNEGKGSIDRKSPYLIFHQAANRKPVSAIRWENYKLVKDWRYNSIELFDLSKDLEEKEDLSNKMPELVKKLEKALIRYI